VLKLKHVKRRSLAFRHIKALTEPFRNTEVATVFISLEMLEWLADPYHYRKPNPFELVFHRYYRTRWCEIALDAGLIAVAHEPQNISVYKLATQEKAAIVLQPLGNGIVSHLTLYLPPHH
jgi:hypothetical protein